MSSSELDHEPQPYKTTPSLPAERGRAKRRWPPLFLLILIELLICGVSVLQILAPNFDRQFFNIYSWVLCVCAAGLLLYWFTFHSAHPWRVRLMPLAGVLLVGGLAAATLEVRGWGGTFMPQVAWRGSKRPDEKLEIPKQQVKLKLPADSSEHDFPQFLGPNRNLVVRGVNLARDWQQHRPRPLWRKKIGAGWSSFAAVGGYAVTLEQRGPKELVVCYAIETGDVMWSHAIDGRHESYLGGVGPRSTPTIHDGKVYALGATGIFRCLDFKTGAELWKHNLLELYDVGSADNDLEEVAWGRAGSPLIVDDLVVIPGGGRSGSYVSLVAFDKVSGDKAWESGTRQVSYASPNVATLCGERQIVIANQDYVTGHSLGGGVFKVGQVLWEFEWPGLSRTGANISQAVALPGDRVLISKGYGGGGAVFQISKDEKGQFHAEEVWHNRRVLKTKFTNVAIRAGFSYALSDGILECVDLARGEPRWKGGRGDGYDHGQILMVDDVLLVLTEEGQVVMLDVNPNQQREFGRFQAIEGKTWSNLCLYGNRLLVRNAEEVACYELAVNHPQEPEVMTGSIRINRWMIVLVVMGAMSLCHTSILVFRRR